jgi:hypothetical protein
MSLISSRTKSKTVRHYGRILSISPYSIFLLMIMKIIFKYFSIKMIE